MEHLRFNRHEIFNSDDRRLVLNLISDIDTLENDDVVNMLYGLFDGFWYMDLEEKLIEMRSIHRTTIIELMTLLNKVEDHIIKNGETITAV